MFAAAVNAASLVGKVIEVNSGDVITLFNLNRPVRVRLLGVDAPEMDQAFGSAPSYKSNQTTTSTASSTPSRSLQPSHKKAQKHKIR